jgi:hypothetical protein
MKPIIYFTIILLSMLGCMSCNQDPCEGSMCANGGVCVDGTCDCPEQFTGPGCKEQATPDIVRVREIAVIRFPSLNNNMSWDATDGPDLYFKISDEEYPLAQPIIPIENANQTNTNYFFIESFDMRSPTRPYIIELFDYDGAGIPSQKLGEISFVPYHSTNGFPEKITIDNGGPVAFTMTLEYRYTMD